VAYPRIRFLGRRKPLSPIHLSISRRHSRSGIIRSARYQRLLRLRCFELDEATILASHRVALLAYRGSSYYFKVPGHKAAGIIGLPSRTFHRWRVIHATLTPRRAPARPAPRLAEFRHESHRARNRACSRFRKSCVMHVVDLRSIGRCASRLLANGSRNVERVQRYRHFCSEWH